MSKMKIDLPTGAAAIIAALEQAGYEAWLVGGCVRDSLLGKAPEDWDICTSATPQQAMADLADYAVTLSGLKHGTVTVRARGQHYEVTSFRADGPYSDHRRPDGVEFVKSLREDLARRDFTINAMAWHPKRGLADFFGGSEDLAARRIRAVGEPERRFNEDGLRIMRALRLASVFDFSIEPATAAGIIRNRELLPHIAAERLQTEFIKLLCGPGVTAVLEEYAAVIGEIIPEILPMIGFEQHNHYHHLDVWQHTLTAIGLAPAEATVRLALFFHDIGKPGCYKLDEDGVAHYLGHGWISAELAQTVMHRLRFDNATIHAVRELVFYHDATVSAQPKGMRRWLHKLGEEQLRRLLTVKKADALAHRPSTQSPKLRQLEAITACMEQVLTMGQCYTLRQLAVDGRDLLALGLPPGAAVGRVLDELLRMVIEEQIENEAAALLAAASRLIEK